ncbi:T9SS type A sorting domain-containing protein [bacterium]|nr:T9SS type A sorting domain-containing protein [bacterium]
MLKKIVMYSLLLTSAVLNAQIPWEGPMPVGAGTVMDFDLDPVSGNLHVVSAYSGNPGVLYTVLDPDGNPLSQEKIAGTEADKGHTEFISPSITVDYSGTPHICYRKFESTLYYVSIYYIRKAGAAWSTPLEIVKNSCRAYIVRMAADRNNRIHVVTAKSTTPPDGMYGKWSYHLIVDGQKTSFLDIGNQRCDNRMEIAVGSNGDVHIVSGQPNAGTQQGKIEYYKIPGGNGNIELVEDIHSTDCYSRNGAPDVFCDQNGNTHFCYGSKNDSEIDGKGSIRYVKYQGGTKVIDRRVTPGYSTGALETWKDNEGWGLASVASSANGQYVLIVYLTKLGGDMYSVFSTDGGVNWAAPQKITPVDPWTFGDGRDLHLVRAYRNNFYVLYPRYNNYIRLHKIIKYGVEPPVADAGGPYSGFEGTPLQMDASASSDPSQNGGLVKFEWDWDHDGIFDEESAISQPTHLWDDDFIGTVTLRVTNGGGDTDTDETQVSILNRNPVIQAGQDLSGLEGDTFSFNATIQDPGNDEFLIGWKFGDQSTGAGLSVNHVYLENGVYTVIAGVEDDDGGTDLDTLVVTVQNAPPTADAGGPYSGYAGNPVDLTGQATDPGSQDTFIYSWDTDNNGTYESAGQSISTTFSTPGVYPVWFRVQDDDGGSDVDSVHVKILKNAPKILDIPDQVIAEGGAFLPIALDQWVTHPSQSASDMNWSCSGNVALKVKIQNRILTVQPPDADWNGEESLYLTVRDLFGNSDDQEVLFTVTRVNTPPSWKQAPLPLTFPEDSSLILTFLTLRGYVEDADHASGELSFNAVGDSNIWCTVTPASQNILLTASPRWHGRGTVQFIVLDPEGLSDTTSVAVTVTDVIDPPAPFSLISPTYMRFVLWPGAIHFYWNASHDPDGNAPITYVWQLVQIEPATHEILAEQATRDTTLRVEMSSQNGPGVYGWRVWAVKALGDSTLSTGASNGMYFIRVDPVSGIGLLSDMEAPDHFGLAQNVPNPFNPATEIQYMIAESGPVTLSVYNMLGQRIRLLDQGLKSPGTYRTLWDGRNADGLKTPSGIYICRLETAKGVFMKKMMLLE